MKKPKRVERGALLRRRVGWAAAGLLGCLSSACESKPLCMVEEYDVELLEVRERSGGGITCPAGVDLPRSMSIRPLEPGGMRGVGACQHQGIEYIEPLGEFKEGGIGASEPVGFQLVGSPHPKFKRAIDGCEMTVVASFYFSTRYFTVEEAYEGFLAGDREAFRWGFGLSADNCGWLNTVTNQDYCWIFYQAALRQR